VAKIFPKNWENFRSDHVYKLENVYKLEQLTVIIIICMIFLEDVNVRSGIFMPIFRQVWVIDNQTFTSVTELHSQHVCIDKRHGD
jgi:hypothetical protein